MIIVGIDPDSNKHGVAVYENGKLTNLITANNCEIFQMFLDVLDEESLGDMIF